MIGGTYQPTYRAHGAADTNSNSNSAAAATSAAPRRASAPAAQAAQPLASASGFVSGGLQQPPRGPLVVPPRNTSAANNAADWQHAAQYNAQYDRMPGSASTGAAPPAVAPPGQFLPQKRSAQDIAGSSAGYASSSAQAQHMGAAIRPYHTPAPQHQQQQQQQWQARGAGANAPPQLAMASPGGTMGSANGGRTLRCMCGHNAVPPRATHADFVQCIECSVWQHARCTGHSNFMHEESRAGYVCEQCRVMLADPFWRTVPGPAGWLLRMQFMHHKPVRARPAARGVPAGILVACHARQKLHSQLRRDSICTPL